MAAAGDELHGADGFRLRLVRMDPEVLEMEATYSGAGGLPPEHLHPQQSERFEVLEGAVHTIVDGHEQRHTAGDTFEVPRATPHQMAADGPARLRWEVRPALRTAEFFERLTTGPGADDGPSFYADLLDDFSDEIRLTGR